MSTSVLTLRAACGSLSSSARIRSVLHELASAAPAALAFGLLLRKLLPARLPAARIPGAFEGVLGEFGRGVDHGWSSCPQARQPESRRPVFTRIKRISS